MKTAKTGFIASLTFAAIVFSGAPSANEFKPGWYANLHLGKTDTSLNQASQDFSYLSIGGSFGYRFSEIIAAEFFMSFATNGERDEIVSSLIGEEVETEFDAVGFYLTAQSRGDYYIKGRAGLVESRFIYSANGYEDASGKDVGFSYGIGGGAKFDSVRLELEYVVMPEVSDPLFADTSYDTKMMMISLGTDF